MNGLRHVATRSPRPTRTCTVDRRMWRLIGRAPAGPKPSMRLIGQPTLDRGNDLANPARQGGVIRRGELNVEHRPATAAFDPIDAFRNHTLDVRGLPT